MLEFIAAGDELLHIGWSSTSRAAQYEAHGLQLELVLGAHAPGRAAITRTKTWPSANTILLANDENAVFSPASRARPLGGWKRGDD